MAYFDSPKNRALWEKELSSLDEERARREQEGFRPRPAQAPESPDIRGIRMNPFVTVITLAELEEIERAARAKERAAATGPERQREGQMERERQTELSGPSIEVPTARR